MTPRDVITAELERHGIAFPDADVFLAALQRAGLVIVPRVATPEMIFGAENVWDSSDELAKDPIPCHDHWRGFWTAMVAAAENEP